MVKTWLKITSLAFGIGFGLSLPVTRNMKDSALVGLASIPASTSAFIILNKQRQQEVSTFLKEEVRILQQQKDRLNRSLQELQDQLITDTQKLSSLQYELETLQQNKETLQQTVNLTTQKAEQFERHLEELSNQKRELENRVDEINQEKETIQITIRKLENEKQFLTRSSDQLFKTVQTLQLQENSLKQSLAELNNQLTNDRREQERLQQELNNLVTQRQHLTNETTRLANELQQLQAKQSELTSSLEQLQKQNNELKKEQEELSAKRDEIDREIQQYHQQHNTLRESLVDMVDTQDIERLTKEATAKLIEEQDNPSQSKIQSTEKQQAKHLPPNTGNVSISYASANKANQDDSGRESERQKNFTIRDTKKRPSFFVSAEEFTLSNPDHTEWLWEDVLLPRWQHPPFLGSICLPLEDTNEVWGTKTILDIVGKNLRNLGTNNLNYDRVCEHFDDEEKRNWLKIMTFALSEYAYYGEDNAGFWQGVCDRLHLQNTQGNQNTLREVVKQGSNLLGLRVIRDKGDKGFRYVSTLYLQSGIPQQNLGHFAQLLEEITQQYDWWDIAHAEPEDLSQILYEFCQHKHPQWRKLLKFLEISCMDGDKETEPISGELLQGLAIVAQALERQRLEPEVLQDVHKRKQLLQNFCLPNMFFLRSWDNIIQVLTPQEKSSNYRSKLVSLRKKPLLLMLDVHDSMDIQLVLSAQTLWQPDWQNYRGTYARIEECKWETTLPRDGALEIPQLAKPLYNVAQDWVWYLRSHTNQSLVEWRCQGIAQDFPVLIFDAWTGDRLIPPDELKGKTEIICFFDTTVQLEISEDIEIIDSFVPCSISGWRGQQLHLIGEKAQLIISKQIINWDRSQIICPQLRGIKLKSKELTYLEVPSIWYPPITIPKVINIEIENIEDRQVLTKFNEKVDLSISSKWQEINLSTWINHSGTYAVKLWCASERWSEKFKLMDSFSLKEAKTIPRNKVYDRMNQPIEIPQKVSSKDQFWLAEFKLDNLWLLEKVRFLLSNGKENYNFFIQADISGNLSINLASLRDKLPESDWYSLSYQRSGEEIRSLLEISTGELISCTWAENTIYISGLLAGCSYSLSLWNLLRPDREAISIPINQSDITEMENRKIQSKLVQLQQKYTSNRASFTHNLEPDDTLTVTLAGVNDLGIFLIQLQTSTPSLQVLGWWSNISERKFLLPDDVNYDDYCFNILDNEPLEDFVELTKNINFKLEPLQIKAGISSLQNGGGYLPNWLDRSLLARKLEKVIKSVLPSNNPPMVITSIPNSPQLQSLTYQVEIKNNIPAIRKNFCKRFTKRLKKDSLEQSIELIKDEVVRELLRVRIKDEQYLPSLKKILDDLGQSLGTSIKLKEWR